MDSRNKRFMEITRTVGRPSVRFSAEQFIEQYNLFHNWSDVARFFGVSRQTIYRIVKRSGYKKTYL